MICNISEGALPLNNAQQSPSGLPSQGEGQELTELPFPVKFACQECGAPLAENRECGCSAGSRLEFWNGIPRTLFGQSYWGECSPEKMGRILAALETTPWKEALAGIAGGEPVHRYLTNPVEPAFIYQFPWDEIDTVLDIGAGMGFIAAPMAAFGKRVVALEAVPERALFMAHRARQDGLQTLFPMIGNAMQAPFPAESFDLITLNGVFEYIGLWGQGNPQTLQERFLAKMLQLLKPSGRLYIGIETRFGLASWRGTRDHSGLKYTGLMPRRMADLYCRLRKSPYYGSAAVPSGYRTYCHTPAQYRRMLVRTGFERVQIFGCHPGYNSHRAVYPLDAYFPRRTTRRIMSRPHSWLGKLRSAATESRWLYRHLEDEVLLFAQKPPFDCDGDSGGDRSSRIVQTQISSDDKVGIIRFRDDRPLAIRKAAKSPSCDALLRREFEFLQAASAEGAEGLDVGWPKPLAIRESHGIRSYEYEFVDGVALSTMLYPPAPAEKRFFRCYSRLVNGYIALCGRLTAALQPADGDRSDERVSLADAFEQAEFGLQRLQERIARACEKLRTHNWATGAVHGDLSLANTIVAADESIVLIDWENASRDGLAAIDLVRLYYDTWHESQLLKPAVRRRIIDRAGGVIRACWTATGIALEDIGDVEALYFAHQQVFMQARGDDVERVSMAALEAPSLGDASR